MRYIKLFSVYLILLSFSHFLINVSFYVFNLNIAHSISLLFVVLSYLFFFFSSIRLLSENRKPFLFLFISLLFLSLVVLDHYYFFHRNSSELPLLSYLFVSPLIPEDVKNRIEQFFDYPKSSDLDDARIVVYSKKDMIYSEDLLNKEVYIYKNGKLYGFNKKIYDLPTEYIPRIKMSVNRMMIERIKKRQRHKTIRKFKPNTQIICKSIENAKEVKKILSDHTSCIRRNNLIIETDLTENEVKSILNLSMYSLVLSV